MLASLRLQSDMAEEPRYQIKCSETICALSRNCLALSRTLDSCMKAPASYTIRIACIYRRDLPRGRKRFTALVAPWVIRRPDIANPANTSPRVMLHGTAVPPSSRLFLRSAHCSWKRPIKVVPSGRECFSGIDHSGRVLDGQKCAFSYFCPWSLPAAHFIQCI